MEWWAGLALNVISTFFLCGELMSEVALRRVLYATLILLALATLLVQSLLGATGGSMVDTLAAVWGQHTALRPAGASALLTLVPTALLMLVFDRRLRVAGYLALVLLANYGISIAQIIRDLPLSPPPDTAEVRAAFSWVTLHPSLALHHTYATATLWGLTCATVLPLLAGQKIAEALAQLPKRRAVVVTVGLCGLIASWILQLVGAL